VVYHKCELEDGIDVLQIGLGGLFLTLPKYCDDDRCGCTHNIRIRFCPVCGYEFIPHGGIVQGVNL